MSFLYEFEEDFDTVSIAFAQPYTYTELQHDLEDIVAKTKKKGYVSRDVLCKTIVGTKVDLITITSPDQGKIQKEKKAVILTGRVHPGETVGSWMMKGLIDFLISEEKEAAFLRENCIFKIIPILNPDGVIQGNYRCSLAGCDLNRKFVSTEKVSYQDNNNRRVILRFFM